MGDVTGSTVYVVTGECLHYYCGCRDEVGHILGVATTLEDAERIRAEARKAYCDVRVEPVELPLRRREEV